MEPKWITYYNALLRILEISKSTRYDDYECVKESMILAVAIAYEATNRSGGDYDI